MRNFAICLVLLNLLYLSWTLGFLPGSDNSDVLIIREPVQQAPESLVLLSELSDVQIAENATEEVAAEALDTEILNAEDLASKVIPEEVFIPPSIEVENDRSNPACFAIGDFENVAVSNALVSELRLQGLQATVELQEQIESEYRVYMPPFTSDAAARQTLANLLENGIDSFLITDGDLSRGISLGVFSLQALAFNLQEELASEGYATNIQETVRSNTEFWIVINSATSSELEALWQTLLNTWPSLKQSENLCEIIAPED
ncbi:MAG: hypothetical protein COA71_04440 [SAR86 cluster bacterium]|uniref:SPOR domain-containing protein n=1 Tax=SAR86 cluster bacterium TaxID=2030880 RepID=A0A2A5CGX9_9GAMM|nr:MAG: hypothetical protein COA71_04440 [SAR86 cluster bacterium]